MGRYRAEPSIKGEEGKGRPDAFSLASSPKEKKQRHILLSYRNTEHNCSGEEGKCHNGILCRDCNVYSEIEEDASWLKRFNRI